MGWLKFQSLLAGIPPNFFVSVAWSKLNALDLHHLKAVSPSQPIAAPYLVILDVFDGTPVYPGFAHRVVHGALLSGFSFDNQARLRSLHALHIDESFDQCFAVFLQRLFLVEEALAEISQSSLVPFLLGDYFLAMGFAKFPQLCVNASKLVFDGAH
jgi:hypothetical protein